jgi:hypothetical protein
VNWYGTWDLSPSLRATIVQHPTYRARSADFPESNPKNNLLHLIESAKSLAESEDASEQFIFQLSQKFEAIIELGTSQNSAERQWMQIAMASEQFWLLLQTCFSLGKHDAIWHMYEDGTIETLTRKALLKHGGRYESVARMKIEKLYVEFVSSEKKRPTALSLLKWLGGERPKGSDALPIVFRGERAKIIEGISWSKFNEIVKSIKKKRK